jgi:hypothetical protein
MGFMDWLRKQSEAGRQERIRRAERGARVEQAKAGKSLRRSKPHIKAAERAEAKAACLRKQGDDRC